MEHLAEPEYNPLLNVKARDRVHRAKTSVNPVSLGRVKG